MKARLVFVYNANAGLLAGAIDSVHKTLSPDSYACNLCAVTHGIFAMRPQWRQYLKELPIDADFYHRPDFRVAFPQLAGERLPLVGRVEQEQFTILLDADALGKIATVDELVAALQTKLAID